MQLDASLSWLALGLTPGLASLYVRANAAAV
jgi:hypothetical protein